MTLHDREPDALPALSPEEERRLTELLHSAFAPHAIDPERHERLLQAALEDPFAAPSAEEIVESERLRQALDGEGPDHLDLVLARALAAAHAPSALAPNVVPPATFTSPPVAPRAHGKVLYVRFGAALAGLAAAAALLLAIGSPAPHTPAPGLPALALAQSRSTAPLFQSATAEPPSARIDRIASVRERDLRSNRYALWGVR